MNAQNTPLVSVMMITYNQERFIRESILSVILQDYPNLELIISDDASTDNTQRIIKELSQNHQDKIFYSFNQKNLGITKNSNIALRRCKGVYVALAYGDDVMLPRKISTQVNWFRKNSIGVLCGHNVEIFSESSGATLYTTRYRKVCGRGAEEIIRNGGLYLTPSIMFKRSAAPRNGFDERIPLCSDYLFLSSLLAGSNGIYGLVPGTYARYRRHSSNATRFTSECLEDIERSLIILKDLFPRYHSACEYASFKHIDYQKAIYLLADGKYIQCLNFLVRLSRRYPYQLKIYFRLLQLPMLALISSFFPGINKLIFPHKQIGL